MQRVKPERRRDGEMEDVGEMVGWMCWNSAFLTTTLLLLLVGVAGEWVLGFVLGDRGGGGLALEVVMAPPILGPFEAPRDLKENLVFGAKVCRSVESLVLRSLTRWRGD